PLRQAGRLAGGDAGAGAMDVPVDRVVARLTDGREASGRSSGAWAAHAGAARADCGPGGGARARGRRDGRARLTMAGLGCAQTTGPISEQRLRAAGRADVGGALPGAPVTRSARASSSSSEPTTIRVFSRLRVDPA